MGKLNDKKVKQAAPGRYCDGNGLRLHVRKSGSRDWTLRVTVDGVTSDYGLGGYPLVSLAEARIAAFEKRKSIKNGEPQIKRFKVGSNLFESLAEAYIKGQEAGWKNPKSAGQWRSSLKNYAYPVIGKKSAQSIKVSDILDVLKPIWDEKTETASRVRGRIEKVLDYAKALGVFSGENPARWQGNLASFLPKRSKVQKVKHFNALDYRELPKFWKELSKMEGNSAAALRWTILNAVRSGESRGAKFKELDQDKVWIIPEQRMKASREQRIPLTDEALATIPPKDGEKVDLLFPAPKGGMLSDMSLSAVLKRMGRDDITVHGFRSTFRDWAGETTAHPREVIEHALAHQLKDKAEAAYARSDLLAKRRKLMEDWAKYVTGGVK
ncbi:MAG: tyrosine-type recombinase/integrase [Methylophilaceae bacterium]